MEVVNLQPGQDGSLLDLCSGDGDHHNDNRHLGSLSEVQELVVRQQWDIRETLRGTEEPNVYFIYDKVTGQKLYHMKEKETCCRQQCCGANRGFNITIFDKHNRAVIEVKRPSACCYGGCFPFLGCFSCFDGVSVAVKNYKILPFAWDHVGTVKQNWNPIWPSFDLRNASGKGCVQRYSGLGQFTVAMFTLPGTVQYRLTGPVCTSGCLTNVTFHIRDSNTGEEVGRITKVWSGLCHKMNSDTDLFSIKFPPTSDEKVKAALLASLIFIDFKYFEECCPQCCSI